MCKSPSNYISVFAKACFRDRFIFHLESSSCFVADTTFTRSHVFNDGC